MTVNTDMVTKSWGNDAPAWVKTLAAFCDSNSQTEAAKRIDRSPSLVNMVLKNRYAGNLAAIQANVETAFATAHVACPVLGDISGQTCLKTQTQPYNPGNHMAVRLFIACRSCPNNVNGGNNAQ